MISICIKDSNSKFLKCLFSELKNLKMPEMYYSKHSFKIYENIIVHYKGDSTNKFYNVLSSAISNAIITYYEPQLLKKIINTNYFYFDNPDKKVVLDEYKILVNKFSLTESSEKMNMLVIPLTNYLENNKSIIIEGFINFRLPDYINHLDSCVQEAVNQFILDKEYFEFVNLLKGYVDSKVPNNKIVNLVYVNSEAILLSDKGDIIELDSFNSVYLSDITFSNNDYVLNTLVGLLPTKIILHLITPKDNFIDTIKLIFENKVTVCDGCEMCHAYNTLKMF